MRKFAFLGLLLLAAATVVGGALYWYSNLKVSLKVSPERELLGLKNNLTLSVKPSSELPLTELEIKLIQGNKTLVIYKGKAKEFTRSVLIEPKKEGFKEGKVRLVALLKTPVSEEKVFEKVYQLDLTPPSAEILYAPEKLKVGRPSPVVIKTSEAVVGAAVTFGEARFPLLPYKDGTMMTFITAPLFALEKPSTFKIELTDAAGNTEVVAIPTEVVPIKLKEKKVLFDERKLRKLILKYFPEVKNPVEQFKTINKVYRKEDERKLREICSNSETQIMFKDNFLQLPGSAVTGRFAEKRLYYLKNTLLGSSVHKGMDLAKYKNAPVTAANDGKVVFAGKLKIYGNTVIIDHGFGIYSLYGHLKDYRVKVGQEVKKKEIIGRTDTTGFALGDHLHFGVLVWGYATDPYFYFIKWNMNHYIYGPLKKIFSSQKK